MRNRQLQTALESFAEEAAWQLAAQAQEGDAVPFEIVETTGRRRDTPLYCYRPLTADFIRQRLGLLGRLPSYLPAVHALAASGGLDAYLAAHGEEHAPAGGRVRAEVALRLFLTRTFEDSTDFVLEPDRLRRAILELEDRTGDGRALTDVLVPIHGLRLLGEEVPMGEDLVLARGDLLEDVPAEAAWPRGASEPNVVAIVSWEAAPGEIAPLEHARARVRRLLTALRLYTDVPVTAGAGAWTRTGGGAWCGIPSGLPVRPTTVEPGEPVLVHPDAEDELRAFCSLIARRAPRSGPLAWALSRHEMGLGQADPAHALADHLHALRALLEPEGPHTGLLAGRVAALCAEPAGRAELRERVGRLVALERAAIAGVAADGPTIAPYVQELAGHLRAILRDILCGHLDADVRTVADRLLAQDTGEHPTVA